MHFDITEEQLYEATTEASKDDLNGNSASKEGNGSRMSDRSIEPFKITVAGVGYVGLSLAVLLAQHNKVMAVTTTPAKAEDLNKFISPIQDDEIERFFREAKAGERKLDLTTTYDKEHKV